MKGISGELAYIQKLGLLDGKRAGEKNQRHVKQNSSIPTAKRRDVHIFPCTEKNKGLLFCFFFSGILFNFSLDGKICF